MKNNTHTPATHYSKGIYVSADFLAEKYGVSARYILKLATESKIPCLRLGRKCVRFDPDAVAEAIGDKKS